MAVLAPRDGCGTDRGTIRGLGSLPPSTPISGSGQVSLGEASGRYWCPTLTAVKRSTCPGGRRAKGVYFMLKTKKDKEH